MSENSASVFSSFISGFCAAFDFSTVVSAEILSGIIFPHSFDVVLNKHKPQIIASVYMDVFFIRVVLKLGCYSFFKTNSCMLP